MVTGIETAGLILGSLPLVIEGLQVYQRGVKRLKRSVTYDVSLKKLIRRVNEQKIYLEDNLEKLLRAACSHKDVILTPADDYWQELSNGPTGEAVKEYLGEKKQKLFEELLEEFEICLVELANDLDSVQRAKKKGSTKKRLTLLDIQSLATFHDPQGKNFTKRVMYLIKEEEISKLTDELDSLNTSMNILLANITILQQQKSIQESRVIPDERKALALASVFKQIRAYTDRLFQAFHAALDPSCHPSHNVALFLDTPVFPTSKQLSGKSSSFRFRVMLTGNQIDITISSLWHEANVTVFEDDGSVIPQPPPNTPPNATNAPSPPSISITAPPSEPGLAEVDNLCSDITSASQTKGSLDLLLRYGKYLLRHDPVRCRSCEPAGTCDTINLEQLLSSRRRISPREKVKLAFKLATALLQLKTSQWLQTSWSNQAIYFRKVSRAADSYDIEVDQPLVLQSFSHAMQHTTSEQKPKTMFLELGILLLEIWNEKLFAAFAKEGCQIAHIAPMMRQGIASEWYDRTYMDMTSRYGKVVQTCVNFAFEFNPGQQSWDDEDLRKSVCAKIISPLNEECGAFPDSNASS